MNVELWQWLLLGAWAACSFVLYVLMYWDKRCARKKAYRVPERTLFLWAACLGAAGGTAGMFAFRHKTRHWYFRWGFPAIAIVQAVFVLYLLCI